MIAGHVYCASTHSISRSVLDTAGYERSIFQQLSTFDTLSGANNLYLPAVLYLWQQVTNKVSILRKQEQTVYQSAAFHLWQHSLYQQLFTRCKQFRSQQSISKLEAESRRNLGK
jgi:hypothetical protein